MDNFKLKNELAAKSTKNKIFQILALSGDGRRSGRPIGSCSDLIAGTPVGGILAAGVSLEVPARQMRDLFIQRGQEIFSGRPRPKTEWLDFGRSLFGPKYDGKALRSVVTEIIGERRWLHASTACCKYNTLGCLDQQ
ncbi:hypothetical protein I6F09_25195 [Bradyrhizobium sp. IC3195]|uniref:hypothetical protein n=1 Tax=Bradyrhizobium sp. IC3195 TaxID=2793804 RepID=UPI001CD59608|nr:hypothetical protein [Bradyrhizobium sp. IC3195]MCA1471164.1 hypothetical protein [Bradyrhizobium sp. IC3195]